MSITQTRFGFEWENARVERVMQDRRYGVVVRVQSVKDPTRFIDIRVSPGGQKVEALPRSGSTSEEAR